MQRSLRMRLAGVTTLALISAPLLSPAAFADNNEGYFVNVPQSKLKTIMADSEESDGPIANILDGNPNTIWHSIWRDPKSNKRAMPHHFIVGTADGQPLPDISKVILGTRQSSSGSGRAKAFEVYLKNEGQCTDTPDGWKKVGAKEVPADDLSDQEVTFEAQAANCFKVVYTAAWNGSSQDSDPFASLAEFNVAVHKEGTPPPPPAPEPTQLKELPLADGATPTGEILDPYALDERRADNPDKSPIAYKIPGHDGQDRVIGARKSSTPRVLTTGENKPGRFFVDCQANPEGADGSLEKPWTSLKQVNAHGEFAAGNEILFKRGTKCVGLLRPLGSGTEGNHITIDAYGDPSANLPLLEGRGEEVPVSSDDIPALAKSKKFASRGVESAVVRLFNQEYWTIRNLEITNYSGDGRDYKRVRRGVAITLEDYGRGNGYTVSDLYIHDVLGRPDKDLGGSGGIQFEAYAGAKKKPTSFGGIEVAHNTIRHVSRSGINEGSNFRARPSVGGSIGGNAFEVWAPMDVHDNIVSDVAGDGIVTQFASGTKVYNNTVYNTANHHGGKSPGGNNAAVWPWDADHVTYSQNHVFDTRMPDGTWDGTAFDSDYGTTGTTFEYNIAHDNQGGFMLFCGCGGLSTQTVMRYNISINDGRGGEHHKVGSRLFFVAGQTDAEVYNNTFLVYPGAKLDKGASKSSAFVSQNNVFLAQGAVSHDWNENIRNSNPYRSNLYVGAAEGWPAAQHNQIVADAKMKSAQGLGKIQPADELVAGKGIGIAKAEVTAFNGVKVPANAQPDLGAFQLKSVTADALVANGGFEQGDGGWVLSGAQIQPRATAEPRNGNFALQLPNAEATAEQSIKVGVNRTHRLVAAVKADADGKLPTITLTNPKGVSVQAQPLPATTSDNQERAAKASEWVNVSALMRTAWDASELKITVTGPGSVDDVALEVVPDYVVDGSFQSFQNTPWGNWNTGRTEDAVSGNLALVVNGPGSSENAEVVVPRTEETYTLAAFAKTSDQATVKIGAKGYLGDKTQHAEDVTSTEWKQTQFNITPTTARFTAYCYLPSGGNAKCDDFMLVKAWDGTVPAIAAEAAPEPEKPAPTPAPEPEKPEPTPAPEQPNPAPAPENPAPTPAPEKPEPVPAPEQPAPAPAPEPEKPSPAPEQPAPAPEPSPEQPAPAPTPEQPTPVPAPEQPAPGKPAPAKPSPAQTSAPIGSDSTDDSGRRLLPRTGSNVLGTIAIAALLLTVGVGTFSASRRHRK